MSSKPTKKTDSKQGAAKAIIGITTPKFENFSGWYSEVILKSECIEYYDVSGCYILRPWGYGMWEKIVAHLDGRFKRHNVKNCYFPMFVTKSRLEAEENHIEGFAAEVAWVTKSGTSDLVEPIAIRPTSETIMYPAFQKWIRSHRDLPLLLNQWCPIVRWEFSHPTPFIRTREFLWQEGHTAHATEEQARDFAMKMLEEYRRCYEEVLAVPVIPGRKTRNEKFAGGDTTYTVETYIHGVGRAVQAATSHYLGTNFAKLFEVEYENENKERALVHQTSFGYTTRSVGTMIMIHGDDQGLVMPPRAAVTHVVIVPIMKKGIDEEALYRKCEELAETLRDSGLTVECDTRTIYNPGWKYNHWEMRGVPIRLELGPRDLEQGTCRIVRRFDGQKADISQADVAKVIAENLEEIQKTMLERARATMNEHIVRVTSFEQVMPELNKKNLLLAPWCDEDECEDAVKAETGRLAKMEAEVTISPSGEPVEQTLSGAMKSLCIPLEQPEMPADAVCFHCRKPAKVFCLWGRSY